MLVQLKKHFYLQAIALFAALSFFSCQKEVNNSPTNPVVPGNETPDLGTKVTSSVSGFVTDENDAAVEGATVQVGIASVTTDEYGFFEVRNVQVVKNAAVVTVTRPGYFKGIKTYIASTGKAAFFRIKLIPKTIAGTIDGTTGGNVTLASGLTVALPVSGVVNAATGAAYTGQVSVAAYWLNPTAVDITSIMPGDLRALNTSGALKSLQTYGMAAVELTGVGGELLQIASGKKATLTFPLPTSLAASAPATIQLWYFDEAIGLWKEDGTATKTGNTYVGDVSHFSFWNCDVPDNYVQFNCTVVDAAGNPIPYVGVRISEVSNPNNWGWGFTDSSGYASGAVPDNAQLLLEIYTYYNCGTSLHTQTFTTTNTNISLGSITITNTGSTLANVSGTVTNCTGGPVTNGYVIMKKDFAYYRYAVDNNGAYNFSTTLCTSPAMVTFVAEDITGAQQSTPFTYTLLTGNNTVGNLQACGISTQEFVNYSIDGTPYSFTLPADSLYQAGNGQNANFFIYGFRSSNSDAVNISVDNIGIALGSAQAVNSFQSNTMPLVPTTGVNATITEYGVVGEFIAGNFTGSFSTQSAPIVNYNINCSFRVRRNF